MSEPHPSHWFREMVENGGPRPPAVDTLGFRLLSVDDVNGAVEGTFEARPEFANMLGGVQGGFLAAMLDALMSCALLAVLPAEHFAPTLQLNLNYLAVAPLGTLTGRGQVVRRGSSVAFLAGELHDPEGTTVTTATATARIIRVRRD
ncbi:PaaI family thioesterase [uncultured Jatrophihabitans sp.]|uniref:PaaI family thioesterase n=1 Tax=uncultured Jatrophihabitans sp. TaxID=1610747 RepID=UPI0035CACF15